VPDIYRSAFEKIIGNNAFPYTLLTPSYMGFNIKGSEKLVFCLADRVYELSAAGGDVATKSHLLKELLYIEEGRALLHSWVKICSLGEHGRPLITEYTFNTVSEHIFAPLIKNMRVTIETTGRIFTDANQSRFDAFYQENNKLLNYARRSILPDDKAVQIVYQPEIRNVIVKLFGKSLFRVLSLAHVSILTDRELILIQEGAGGKGGEDIRYGGIFRYIALGKITSIYAAKPKDGVFTLSVYLSDDITLKVVFRESKREDVDALQSRVEMLFD
jgi:hypothetical protein